MATIERRCSLCIMAEFILRLLFSHLRERYPEGTRVELESLYDPCRTELRSGDKGTVRFVDAYGKIFVDWDCGHTLGLFMRMMCFGYKITNT